MKQYKTGMEETSLGLYPTLSDIDTIYKRYTDVDYLADNRKRSTVDVRAFFVKLCLDYAEESFEKIAQYMGRDHSTICHYKKNFEVFVLNNKKAYRCYLRAEQEILDMFPFLLSKLKDRETPVEEGVTLNQIQKKYIRKFHQAKVKIKFYRDYTKKLEEKLKKFDVNEI
jgi:hypothetical protein|tara:strand:+ start:668 stop:1174 length:507 start_codon:yes stop_codon:yes gene_type:complete